MSDFSTPFPPGSPAAREFLYEAFMQREGNAIVLEYERTNRDGKTFSAEILEDAVDHFLTFIGTRNMRPWKATGRAPHKMTVRIQVDVEG